MVSITGDEEDILAILKIQIHNIKLFIRSKIQAAEEILLIEDASITYDKYLMLNMVDGSL